MVATVKLPIKKIARKYNLNVLEDAQAIGSKNKFGMLGTQSDIDVFLFQLQKLLQVGKEVFL